VEAEADEKIPSMLPPPRDDRRWYGNMLEVGPEFVRHGVGKSLVMRLGAKAWSDIGDDSS